ncbi:hypothetical protein N7G274_006943 [Stereocaulon virgatum]|uniref:HMA domain-containing protein n=1 Tax=Stereocaulon virgatum TaxID=373712 RepID=A0ABR4A602_9LECA
MTGCKDPRKGCCGISSSDVLTKVPVGSTDAVRDGNLKEICGGGNGSLEQAAQDTPDEIREAPGVGCGSRMLIQPGDKISGDEIDGCSESTCCSPGSPDPTPSIDRVESGPCTEKPASTSENPLASYSNAANNPASNALDTTTARFATSNAEVIDDVSDIEKARFPKEHITLHVQGMTCSGCEGKLYKVLQGLRQISNIKTSFFLAQAEFDYEGTDIVCLIKNIERKSGFTCVRLSQAGSVLDIIVNGDAQTLTTKQNMPIGVTDLDVLDKNIIRVSYDPWIVGARDLLSNPFFPSAKLAPIATPPTIASGRAHVRATSFMTVLSALLTIPVLILAWASLPKHEVLYQTSSLVLATIVQAVIVGPFYPRAIRSLIFGMVEMDFLVVLSTATAYAYSVVAYAYLIAGRPLSTGSFFETSTLLVTLVMVGRSVSAFAGQKAVESVSVESIQTASALLIDKKSGQAHEIDARLLQYQDTFKVLPETSIVTDGVVITGQSEIDESLITGESVLVAKSTGMPVIAGSINHSGTLTVRLTRLPGENTINTIGTMVHDAQSSKPRIQGIADRFAGYFVPFILVVAVLVFAVWAVVGKVARHHSAAVACINAMTYAISALIVSCPCAIGLAVPMVVVIAGGVGAKNGLIMKSAQAIENARNISHVVFDKTGTLTQGRLSVEAEEYLPKDSDSLKPMILGLTMNSKHPISCAIASHLELQHTLPSQVEDVVVIPGCGIEATWNGSVVRAGNPDWLGISDLPMLQVDFSLGLTPFCVSVDGIVVAAFGLGDVLRPDAVRVVNQLQKRAIKISIVSGDTKEAVLSVAKRIGIPESHIRFRHSPSDKQAYLKEALINKNSVVLFCGDGTNDAAALAQASIGLHMNEGTDIAQSAADVILMRPSLGGVLVMIDLSKAFHRRVVFNFAWAFMYNLFAILLAAGAFPHVRIPPEYAGLGEVVSVLPVIAIAMQLRWVNF